MFGGGANDTAYDVNIIIPEDKLNSLGLTLSSIASTIRSFNLDQPIGNFALGDKNMTIVLSERIKITRLS